ncbi:DUF2975 domain-containing protein [Bacillus salacetis]|uniref:DUF2975 domain-containing protein n=1 Tax=Bacillus salacetis TaxID=2315464 RepID=A0A3A1QZY4_9BACI|nr:DUF2975 domain-containing protein [Bacillus salacetis]RIW32015.1 DUF2975 domain-containing protein [Bacillus salacetis]
MKRETLFLKAALVLLGLPILAACVLGLPMVAMEAAEHDYEALTWLYAIFVVMYISAIPYFAALYQSYRLLTYIDKNNAFSDLSVSALKKIKLYAAMISILYAAGLPFFYMMAEIDDAPGVILIGMVIIFASVVIGVFAAVLQKLLRNAIDIKSENDLTI